MPVDSVRDAIRTIVVQTNCLNNQANGQLDTRHFYSEIVLCPAIIVIPADYLGEGTQPHKHPHSLQLAIPMELAHHYILCALRQFLQSTMWPHQSTEMVFERPASHIKVARPPCLFLLLLWENVSRSTTLNSRT